jgi:hypothetical protein
MRDTLHTILDWAVAIPVTLMAARFWFRAAKWFLGNKPEWVKVKDAFTGKEPG